MRSLCNLLVGTVLAVGVSLYASPEALACGSCHGHGHHHSSWWESHTHSHTRYAWCVDRWPTSDYRRVYFDTRYYTHSWPVHGCSR